jgi:hypothetical protein
MVIDDYGMADLERELESEEHDGTAPDLVAGARLSREMQQPTRREREQSDGNQNRGSMSDHTVEVPPVRASLALLAREGPCVDRDHARRIAGCVRDLIRRAPQTLLLLLGGGARRYTRKAFRCRGTCAPMCPTCGARVCVVCRPALRAPPDSEARGRRETMAMSSAQAERRVVTLADEFLPVYDVSDAVPVVVDAGVDATWQPLLRADLIEVGFS